MRRLGKRVWIWSFLFGFFLGFSSCSHFPLDTGPAAAASNDPTVVISGCGQEPRSGYLFCRVREGANPTERITLHFPKLDCARANCIRFQLTKLDGSFGYGAGVAKGATEASFPMGDVVGSGQALNPFHDGEYQVLVKAYYLDPERFERVLNFYGFIRVNILAPAYTPLVCDDPMVAWEANAGRECRIQYTSAGRSEVCGSCPDFLKP